MITQLLMKKIEFLFDWIRDKWESPEVQRRVSSLMIMVFLAALFLIELRRLEFLPIFMQDYISLNHLHAIDFAFNLLLIKEVFEMILYLPRSISNAQRKQLQILTLILIRFAFKKLSTLGEPVGVTGQLESMEPILEIAVGGLSGLIVFTIVHYFYKLKNQPLLLDPVLRDRFIAEKKMVALVLIAAFLVVGIGNAENIFLEHNLDQALHIFFTIFIFADILIVLISMQYSQLFLSIFRNSGFALATVIVRISVTAPPYYREALAVFAALFSYFIAYVYNKSIVNVLDYLKLRSKKDKKPRKVHR